MILQALYEYYWRKMADPDPAQRLPAFGLEEKEIPFILELTRDGRLASITDTRSGEGKKRVATRFLVPKGVKKSVNIAANLLWGNAEYVLAVPDAKKLAEKRDKGKAEEYLERLRNMHAAFSARLDELPAEARDDEGIAAVRAFLDGDLAGAVRSHVAWGEIAESNPLLSLRLVDDVDLVCQRPGIVAMGSARSDDACDDGDDEARAICLVTGENGLTQRLHDPIKGVWKAQSSGADIVSFNRDAFTSFGKAQGANAPVSRSAAFAYTTALNHLLGKGSRQRMQVGDASTVFWAQKADDADLEAWFIEAFGENDDPDARTDQVRALYEAVTTGRFDGARGENRFFVLGLAPSAARIAVRSWHAAAVREIGSRIREWFDDLRITRGPNDLEYPTLQRLLSALCVPSKKRPYGDIERLPPTIGGEVLRAVLAGTPLPAHLLQAAVQRCRADQAKKTDTGTPVPNVSYHRAALLKASLNRLIRRRQFHGKEIAVSLDPDNTEPAYLAGRLFAAYERVQSDAAERDLNRTIRDTYFGAAMSNPAIVFPRLVQLNQHHMRDMKRTKPGLHVVRDRLIGEIWDKLSADRQLPLNLPLAERARFALGYYHQRQAFFTKSDTTTAPTAASTTSGGN